MYDSPDQSGCRQAGPARNTPLRSVSLAVQSTASKGEQEQQAQDCGNMLRHHAGPRARIVPHPVPPKRSSASALSCSTNFCTLDVTDNGDRVFRCAVTFSVTPTTLYSVS